MRKLSTLIVLFLATPAAFAAAPQQPRPLFREGEVLVTYRDGATAPAAQQLKSGLGLTPKTRLFTGRIELLELPSMLTTAGAIDLLRDDPAVLRASPNWLRFPRAAAVPNDPLFPQQWGLRNTGQANFVPGGPAGVAGGDLDMLDAWDADADGTFDRTGDGTATIAVIDDGVQLDHPDFAANIVAGRDFNGGDNDASPGSGDFHGTMVTGAAAAIGHNGIGVAGTAWNVKLMPLRFNFDTAQHLGAIEFARANGADIINASFGGPTFSADELQAIRDLADDDILYVAASGNDDSNTDVAELNYPANYDAPNILSVAGTNRQDQIVSFSQYGAISTDVAAPGLQILTTQNGGGWTAIPGTSGTSFAAPYAAGIAALLKMHVDADPGTSGRQVPDWREIKARLIEGAEPADDVTLRTAGGRISAANALDMAPRPALVISAADWIDGNNGVLDPGEALSVDITLHNLWRDATNVSGTLAASGPVAVTSGAVGFGNIASDGTATGRFNVTVDSPIANHRYVYFTLTVTADGGYAATRGFIAEVGRLELNGAQATQNFAARSADLYDEFHAWHVDLASLPAGHNQLVIETTSTSSAMTDPDIDLLVKKTVPPRYNITVGINPEDSGFFCTSSNPADNSCLDPLVSMSASVSGTEQVVINNPTPGTFHIVIVNFEQLENGLTYTLNAYTRQGTVPSGGGGGGGGGGAPSPLLLAGLLGAALLRRRR